MKKRVLAILLAATMLLSENSVVSAAEEILNDPVQANVLEEMEDPEEVVSADDAKTEMLPEEEFTGSQPSGEEISWNDSNLVADDPEEPIISTNDWDETENPETENPQATEIAEPQAAAGEKKLWNGLYYEVNEKGEAIILEVEKDIHYDEKGKERFRDRCMYTNGNIPAKIEGHPVTEISSSAFSKCISLTQVTLPDSIRMIGAGAFSECTSLTSVNIPKNMATHGFMGERAYPGAFSGCSSLTSVTFEEGITRIPQGLFDRCPGIREIRIPDTVKEIHTKAFWGCTNLQSITLPKSLQSIGWRAFGSCKQLTEIQLPKDLLTLDPGVFENCSSLIKVNIPASVQTHKFTAENKQYPGPFNGCTALDQVTFENGIKKIPRGLFYAPSGIGIQEITLPDSLRSIDYCAFFRCANLKKVVFPSKLEVIGEEAFGKCSNLEEADLPDSLIKINVKAFLECTKLKQVDLPDSLELLGIGAFMGTAIEEIRIPAKTRTNNNTGSRQSDPGPFAGCAALKKVTFAKNIKQIPRGLFYMCPGIEEIEIPKTVKTIEYIAFGRCTALKKIEIAPGVTEIKDSAFFKCESLETLTLPGSVKTLDVNVFQDCSTLQNVIIPASVKEIKNDAFGGTPSNFAIKGFTNSYAEKYAKENKISFISIGSVEQTIFTVTFDKNASKASLASNKRTKKVTKGKTYGTLPTPSWSNYYFLGWYTARSGGSKVTSGTKVALKKNQTLYAHWAKANLAKTKIKVNNCTWNGKAQKPKVTITLQGATLKSGKDYTLSYSSNKNPGKGKVTVRGKGVFSRSKSKTVYFTISKATQTITAKNATYKASDKGKSITLKVSVKGGAKLTYASSKNDQIRVLNKNSGKLKLMSPGAATITIKAAETQYYKAATKKVTVVLQGAQSISLTSGLLRYDKTTKTYILTKEISNQSIGVSVKGGAKYTCSVVNSAQTSAWFGSGDWLTVRGRGNIMVEIQAEKTKDGVYPALKKSFVIYVNGFQMASEWSYQQSNNGTLTLTKYSGAASKVTIPNTLIVGMQKFAVTALGDGIFENQPVKKVTIQEGSVVTIGKAAFKNCVSLSEIRLNSKTTSIGEEAFYGCTALKSIWLPEGLKTLPASCLKGCTALEGDIYLPKSLTSLGASAFENCGQIRNFIIHSYLNSVDNNAFKNCGSVQKVYFAGPQTRWNCIRIGAGNDALSKICCNAGGASGSYSASNISTENLFYTYPDYLTNEGYDKITGNLEGEMLDVMVSHTEEEELAAAIKSEMINGPGYCLAMKLTDDKDNPTLAEQKMNRALALELLMEEAELSPVEDLAFQKIYKVLEPYKKFGDQIFTNGDTRYQLAMKLDGLFAGRQASEINNMLKVIGEQKRWDKISSVFDGLDTSGKAVDYLMTFITLNKIGNDSLDRLYYRLPKDSGLYNGIEQLRTYLNQPLQVLILDYIKDKAVDRCVKEFQQKVIVDSLDAVWQHKGYTGSHYVYVVTMVCKLIGTMMECPTIDNYNNAWLSIGNARVLRNEIFVVRQELVAAAQKNACDENLKKDYDLLMRMYLFCLKKTGGYVASTMKDPVALNARMARYQDTLDYNSYLAACRSQIN